METTQAVQALSALAQASRLAIFRLLVQAGPAGMAAGSIGEKLELPPATLSFHLAGLTRAGLAQSRQEGRFVIYSADFEGMGRLLAYLTEDCCGGKACVPVPIQFVTSKRRKSA
jgi:ArsR family transcriptional regulator, arsenate/arsenite/antimonite-responsive transcriptional repressor